jgi:Lrp/AsnC family leucine-responsive transcriptional regulator
VHLSASQISRRLQRLAEAGIIAGHAALLDPAASASASPPSPMSCSNATARPVRRLRTPSRRLPEVLDCHSVSGDADYLLRIVAPDLPAFSELMMKRVLRLPGVAQVKTNIALQKVKQSHVLPLDHLTLPARSRASNCATPAARMKLARLWQPRNPAFWLMIALNLLSTLLAWVCAATR